MQELRTDITLAYEQDIPNDQAINERGDMTLVAWFTQVALRIGLVCSSRVVCLCMNLCIYVCMYV